MRIYNDRPRLNITSKTAPQMFLDELKFYRNNNQHHVTLFGKRIINIYKSINIQVIVTEKNDASFGFDDVSRIEIDTSHLLADVLYQYNRQGIIPTVTTSGGEPGIYPKWVNNNIKVVQSHEVLRYNLNTNGKNLEKITPYGLVNLLRYHYNPETNASIFNRKSIMKLPTTTAPLTMQCYLVSGGIDSPKEIKKYMDFFMTEGRGAHGFIFRGMPNQDSDKECLTTPPEYSKDNSVDFFDILAQVVIDNDFEFVEQKIGDHYIYEIYRYKGVFARFSYSDYSLLRKIETEERNKGDWFSRTTIIRPDGKVYAGWAYDLNLIYDSQAKGTNSYNIY